jgi:hypothetical protein
MEVLRYNCGLTRFCHQASALPLAGSPATNGEGDGRGQSRRKGPQ